MITHDVALDAAYGTSAWAPFTRVTLVSPTTAGGETQVVADSVSGTLTVSDTFWPRATLEMSVPAGVTGTDTTAPTTPFGGRVVVEMGATIGGSRYVFQVCDLDVTETFLERPTNAWTIRAVSQEARVNEAAPFIGLNLWEDAQIGDGGTAAGVISAVSRAMPGYDEWSKRYPTVDTLTLDDPVSDGEETFTWDQVWPVIETAMDATAGEAYFRWDRKLVLRDTPVIGSPVMVLQVGDGGTITDYRDVTRWAFNALHAVFTQRSDGSISVGLWENTEPSSPTRVDGPYGRHTRVEERTVTTLWTAARQNRWAATVAKRATAPFRRVELDCVPAPWLEPGDTVTVQLVEGTSTPMLVSGVRIPLSQLDSMTLTMHDSGL